VSDPVRQYLAVAVVGAVASGITWGVLVLGQVLRPDRPRDAAPRLRR
jgi:NADH:ubiquinone oxidoreductase subunit 3 (subunit A)